MKFLEFFPNHKYRYINQAKTVRKSAVLLPDLNKNGYESYFTVNGFEKAEDGKEDNKKEHCTNLNSFFIDIDGRKDKEELESIKARLDPTFILETGHGHHLYWLLDEPIFKDEVDNWDELVAQWERIEQAMVVALKADPVARDVTRIMRVPDTQYWKEGDGKIIIKGIYKNEANTYTMAQVEEVFPTAQTAPLKASQEYSDSERKDFFNRVNNHYPIAERSSFLKLISGDADTFIGESRNVALVVTASLMKQSGMPREVAIAHIGKVGWHGLEAREILTTINSAYANNYTYSYTHPVIAGNMDSEEQGKIQDAFQGAIKERKERDKIRFSTYEKELLLQYPHLRKNEIGMIFNYDGGVYKIISEQDVSSMVLNSLDKDMLWGFRTKRNVSDKIACLIAIIPDLKLTDDRGRTANVKNGLLDIYTRELRPHSPAYVSLAQAPVVYDPSAECPTWLGCLDSWMSGPESDEKKTILQQFAGYCLTSLMSHDRALFLIGDGGNGKSTFVDTISMIVGQDATSHIDLEDLYSQFGMHGLIGKRLNVIEEVHGNYYQSNKLKKLISGEPVTINVKFKPQFQFRPQTKFIFAVNIMPRVDDTSTATERRIIAVVFRNNFRAVPNTNLRGEHGLLSQELSGVLNWMLDGIRDLNEKKSFPITKEQTALLREYRQENSAVEAFIEDCIMFVEGELLDAREVYENYKEYCGKDGRKFKSKIGFTKDMKAWGARYGKFGFKEREYAGATARYEGIRISDEWKEVVRTPSIGMKYYEN